MRESLRFFLVEDEVLLLMQLETFLEAQGHVVAATALSSSEAVAAAAGLDADLALVDIHLADGSSGLDVGRFIAEQTRMDIVFMTANPKRVPDDLSGVIGVIAKPYTQEGLRSALRYLEAAVRHPLPEMAPPRSLSLVPSYVRRWSRARTAP